MDFLVKFAKKEIMTKDLETIAWEKARKIEGYDSDLFRKDACGAWIKKTEYGNRENAYGWEVDHIYPKSKGGGDEADNIRALQHENNASKSDDYPSYTAAVTSEGVKNIYKSRNLTVNPKIRAKLKRYEKK